MTWVSRTQPVVEQQGRVPSMVLNALIQLGGASAADTAHRRAVEDFLTAVCLELAETRRQVLADRRELDRLRAWSAQHGRSAA